MGKVTAQFCFDCCAGSRNPLLFIDFPKTIPENPVDENGCFLATGWLHDEDSKLNAMDKIGIMHCSAYDNLAHSVNSIFIHNNYFDYTPKIRHAGGALFAVEKFLLPISG